ncbi:MAG: sigma-70 family RNA polymerase sigma factor [Saprospiraceae bacterium]
MKSYKFQGSFEGWIRKIMVNLCLKHLNKNKAIEIENLDKLYKYKETESDIVEKMTSKQLLNNILTMPVGYRTVFNLFVIEGYSHKEIAKNLKIEESTSRSQLAKAKLFLKNNLNENDFS